MLPCISDTIPRTGARVLQLDHKWDTIWEPKSSILNWDFGCTWMTTPGNSDSMTPVSPVLLSNGNSTQLANVPSTQALISRMLSMARSTRCQLAQPLSSATEQIEIYVNNLLEKDL